MIGQVVQAGVYPVVRRYRTILKQASVRRCVTGMGCDAICGIIDSTESAWREAMRLAYEIETEVLRLGDEDRARILERLIASFSKGAPPPTAVS